MLSAGSSGYVGAFHVIYFTDASKSSKGPVTSSETSAQSVSEEVLPMWPKDLIDVFTSEEAEHPEAGWDAWDGDTNTSWTGTEGARGWWITAVFEPGITWSNLAVDWAEGSQTNLQVYDSVDAEHWEQRQLPLTNGALDSKYLWLIFPDDGSPDGPTIRDVDLY